jgi:trehalose 6-phosphate synthase/phosphatase
MSPTFFIMTEKKIDKKWIIVSNRLPVHYDKKTGKFVQSTGGLVSALGNIHLPGETKWVGYAENPEKINTVDGLIPVDIHPEIYRKYYDEMSNNVIWPLFHYETISDFQWESWEAYKKVNQLFADKIASIASPNDIVWIHDYHLMLLPGILRKKFPRLQIGFFLHIPFPSSEVFRNLAVRKEILQGVLHANLIGFQDFEYLRHFSFSVYNLLGIESDLLSIDNGQYHAQLGVFPVSIDVKKILRRKTSPQINKWRNKYALEGRKIILGVDRLDYIKGIDLKFKAFRELLKNHPEWRGKVHLYQVAVPSRINVEDYVKTKSEAERLVGQINGEFGHPGYSPIHYIFSSVSFDELLALYSLANVLYVSSKRDGMNLVSMEYIVAQNDDPGVLVISEFTGASSILSDSIRVNPWNLTESSEALHRALLMEKEDRIYRTNRMTEYLKKYDSTAWAKSFLKKLNSAFIKSKGHKTELIKVNRQNKIQIPKAIKDKIKNKKLILLLDYDGTLTPIVENPSQALLNEKTKILLKNLAEKVNIPGFVVVSGRNSTFIYDQIKDTGASIASEHGASFFDRRLKKWISLAPEGKIVWYNDIRAIMDEYAERVPGSFVEKKEYALSWHYRNSPANFGEYQARKLFQELETILANQKASLLWGKKVIEARIPEANKGSFTKWYLSSAARAGFNEDCLVIAIGDDKTDEDLFDAVGISGISIRVGSLDTIAPYFLESQEHVYSFLEYLDKKLV